ncbi:MAG: hypothetical protein JEZ08_25025 [Clostridiales bacterium]|nr:hypothetical protein [Clostridiales bacterium]
MEINKIISSEFITNFYLDFRIGIMLLIVILTSILLWKSLKHSIRKKISLRDIMKLIVSSSIYCLGAIVIGSLIYEIDYRVPISFFTFINLSLLVCVVLLLRMIYIIIFYRSSLPRIYIETAKYLRILLLLVVGAITANNFLGWSEVLLTIVVFFCFLYSEFIIKLLNQYIAEKQEKSISLDNEMPIQNLDDLFDSRKRQLQELLEYFDHVGSTSLSVGIRGTWGEGKTSFINVLKNSIEAEIIHIIPSVNSSTKSMFTQLIKRMEEIFGELGLYTGRGSNLDKYAEYIVTLISANTSDWLSPITDMIKHDKPTELHEIIVSLEKDIQEINEKLSGKRILVIFDDLDRCSKDVIKDTIKFFNLILSIKGFNKIFLFDNDQIRSQGIVDEFISKYFDTLINVCLLDHKEIVDFMIDKEVYFKHSTIETLEEPLKNKFLAFEEQNRYFLENILEDIKTNIDSKSEDIKSKLSSVTKDNIKSEEKEELVRLIRCEKQKLKTLNRIYEKLLKNICNPRYMKSYFREMRRQLTLVNKFWFKDQFRLKSKYSNSDWMSSIASIVTLKVFFVEQFDSVIKCGNIETLLEKHELTFYNKHFLKIDLLSRVKSDNTSLMQFLLFDLYRFASQKEMPTSQMIQEELNNGVVSEKNIISAFESIVWDNSKRLENSKILIDSINRIANSEMKKKITIELIQSINSKTSSNREIELEIFQHYMSTLSDVIKDFNLNEKDKFLQCIDRIIGHYIFGSGNDLNFYLEQMAIIKDKKFTRTEIGFTDTIADLEKICIHYFSEFDNLEGFSDLKRIRNFIHNLNAGDADEQGKVIIDRTYGRLNHKFDVVTYLQESIAKMLDLADVNVTIRTSIRREEHDRIESSDVDNEIKFVRTCLEGMKLIKIDDDIFTHFTSLCKDLQKNESVVISLEKSNELKVLYKFIDTILEKDNQQIVFWDYTYFRLLDVERRIIKEDQ